MITSPAPNAEKGIPYKIQTKAALRLLESPTHRLLLQESTLSLCVCSKTLFKLAINEPSSSPVFEKSSSPPGEAAASSGSLFWKSSGQGEIASTSSGILFEMSSPPGKTAASSGTLLEKSSPQCKIASASLYDALGGIAVGNVGGTETGMLDACCGGGGKWRISLRPLGL